MPQFGATFYPGGVDDYYMPEVIAPAPQRVMPEVPQNMQSDLQRMESDIQAVEPRRGTAPYPPTTLNGHGREPSLSTVLSGQPTGGYGPHTRTPDQPPNYKPFHEQETRGGQAQRTMAAPKSPSFSPFPKVQGEHIPPSDDEKETVLAESKDYVLHSNNPDMQIVWARDVLAYVEVAQEAALRELDATREDGDAPSTRPQTPKIEHELRTDAVNIINYLAQQNHPEALFIRSKWLEFGKFGNRQDKKEAYAGYSTAANTGWSRAEYRIGMLYENSNDVDGAIRHYYRGLDQKDSAALYRMGMISLMGQHGQVKDVNRGLELIHQAADTADEDAPQGAFVYGMIIARDLPDVQIPDGLLASDLSVARQYIEKAAYLGFAKAQLKIGQAYELCQLGCDFNPSLSLHYYGLAARQGQPEACLGVSRWFLFGYEDTFKKNEQLAFKYAQLAAKAKLPTGEFALGYYYEIGIGKDKDTRKARKWYELAAEHGNKDAVGRLESLSQSKTLTKADHETTTLTRIKSQHGSQRGKRPERFKQKGDAMPTLSESDSRHVSPQPSPTTRPPTDGVDMPDPSRLNTMGSERPAFTVNLPNRPKSAAPYPEDDDHRPSPLNVRPRSTAPYPEDDIVGMKPQLSPHYNPNIRQSAGGSQADRPTSAFGIRTQSPGGPPGPSMRGSQSAGTLPVPNPNLEPRGRPVSAGWSPQVPAGYRQPSPGPRGDYRPGSSNGQGPPRPPYDQALGGPAANNPAHSRLQKSNPNPARMSSLPPNQSPMSGYGPGPGAGPGPRESSLPGPAQPGRDYGPRMSSRPMGSVQDAYGGRASAAPQMSGAMGGSQGPGPRLPLKDRPTALDNMHGRSSAPPGSSRPQPASPSVPSPGPVLSPAQSTMSGTMSSKPTPAAPSKTNQGPATFEQMGIPQGKQDNDCVVM